MSRIIVFDTTLRDGEQSPGSSMTTAEKLRMAHELADLGVDVLEAGFAAASADDARAIATIAREVRTPTVAALARATESDIRAAAEAVEGADRPRLHVFLATSDIHLERKLRIDRNICLERVFEAVGLARELVDDVEFSAEDATRTDIDFLTQVVQTAVQAGASTINVPDTVGYAMPDEIREMVRTLFERVPELHDRVLSVHCHDDLGLAVANSLAGVEAGARQVECTLNGIGERAGNAALEEIVMALRVRRDQWKHTTGVRTERIHRASRLLSHLTGIHPQPNKAVVGSNAFAHEAGIHQHGVLSDPETYEIMTPELVGASATKLVMGKHSGRHGLEARYRELGYHLSPEELDRVWNDFKALADRKKEILDEDLISIFHRGLMEALPRHYAVEQLKVSCGTTPAQARLLVSERGGLPREAQAEGDGPIDAAFAALGQTLDFNVVLEHFEIRAATPGEDAVGEVNLRARVDGQTFTGRGADTDVIAASVEAYLHAINKAAQARRLEATYLARTADAWAV
ncbi:MAG: 2-isopropylmalate synthase [Longimicrobiales bacterium]|nr:2-isopropylmalate synthase [Longimicrobiales bacterium]